MKVMNQQYGKLIAQARDILRDIENRKMDLADLALKACTIKLGGHLVGCYSLTNFAEDVGISRKTLSTWVHARKVQIELMRQNIKRNERETNEIMLLIKTDGVSSTEKYSDPERVRRAVDKYDGMTSDDWKLKRSATYVGTAKYRICSLFAIEMMDKNDIKTIYTHAKAICEKLEGIVE